MALCSLTYLLSYPSQEMLSHTKICIAKIQFFHSIKCQNTSNNFMSCMSLVSIENVRFLNRLEMINSLSFQLARNRIVLYQNLWSVVWSTWYMVQTPTYIIYLLPELGHSNGDFFSWFWRPPNHLLYILRRRAFLLWNIWECV